MVKMEKLATPVLIRFLGHENDYIRFGCVAALSEIKSKKALPKLKEQEKKEKHPMISYLIKVAIKNSQKWFVPYKLIINYKKPWSGLASGLAAYVLWFNFINYKMDNLCC